METSMFERLIPAACSRLRPMFRWMRARRSRCRSSKARLLAGLPHDDRGFIPIDEHARVPGADRVYAAGDVTTFPIKQGGLGTQQADAAAEHIAAKLGADLEPSPFHPVLRGKLIVGGESLDLRQDLTGGHGEGVASPDYLWWPPQKVSGRYLSAWLANERIRTEPEPPPSRSLEIEVALPHEWHRDPMALGPVSGPRAWIDRVQLAMSRLR